MAATATSELVHIYQRTGRISEAHELLEANEKHLAGDRAGPMARWANETNRLKLLYSQGQSERVLAEVRTMLDKLSDAQAETDDSVGMANIRELILGIGAMAAAGLGQWQDSLDFTAEVRELHRQRGATLVQQAQFAFKDYEPLLRLGRIGEARDLLQWCQTVFEEAKETTALAMVFGALAEVEKAVGHDERAVEWGMDCLRYAYMSGISDTVARGHHNFGHTVARLSDQGGAAWAHWCAGAIITYQAGGDLTFCLRTLGHVLTTLNPPAEVRAFQFVCLTVERVDGVRFADLVERLPRRASDGQAALDEVLCLAAELGAGS